MSQQPGWQGLWEGVCPLPVVPLALRQPASFAQKDFFPPLDQTSEPWEHALPSACLGAGSDRGSVYMIEASTSLLSTVSAVSQLCTGDKN